MQPRKERKTEEQHKLRFQVSKISVSIFFQKIKKFFDFYSSQALILVKAHSLRPHKLLIRIDQQKHKYIDSISI